MKGHELLTLERCQELGAVWVSGDYYQRQNLQKLVVEQGLTGAAKDEQPLLLSQFGPGVYTFRFRTAAGTIAKRVVAL
jgi:hypothetical protein